MLCDDQGEFIAADSIAFGNLMEGSADDVSVFLKDFVSIAMPEIVIAGLEPVDIHHDDHCMAVEILQSHIEASSVLQSRDGIGSFDNIGHEDIDEKGTDG